MMAKHPQRWIAIPILLFLAALGLVLPTVPERLASALAEANGPEGLSIEAAVSANPRFGLCFVSSAEDHAPDDRYDRALSTGATWNRYPFYWQNVERSAGQYDFSKQDAVVLDDVARGMRTLAILLGTPDVYATGGVAGAA